MSFAGTEESVGPVYVEFDLWILCWNELAVTDATPLRSRGRTPDAPDWPFVPVAVTVRPFGAAFDFKISNTE